MGCRLIRGETIYFVRRGGPTGAVSEIQCCGDELDSRLLPNVLINSDRPSLELSSSVVPIEIRTFDA